MNLVLVSMDLQKRLARSFRALKLVKYLARAGCQLDVVSTGVPEPSLLDETPDRVRFLTVPYQPPMKGSSIPARIINRLLCWPDPQVKWVSPVVRALAPRLRSSRPDAVIVTTPPHVTQLIGVELARELKIPYIADLRDDWLTNARIRWHTPLHRYVARHFESKVVRYASAVLLNTPIVHDRFAKRYSESVAKFHTLTNGYDEDDFAFECSGLPNWPDGKRTLLYAGGSYGGWMTRQLSDLALRMREIGLEKTWRIVTASDEEGWPPAEFSDFWTHLGFLSADRTAAAMCRANVLLLPMPPGEGTPSGTVPLKTYGYLRGGGAIVYLGESGATNELLSKFAGTYCMDRQAWPHLANWLAENESKLSGKFAREGVEEYSLTTLTERLLEIVREVASGSPL